MSNVPYSPTAFATPVINPSVGGFGLAFPYISASMYNFAPTAMDTSTLVANTSDESAQTQALVDTIRRACSWVDRICFGADPAAKGASLCATLSVENANVRIINGQLRLICDYKPIVEIQGIDVGTLPSNTVSIGSQLAQQCSIARRTIYVPVRSALWNFSNNPGLSLPNSYRSGYVYAVWSYVNGYPHTTLASDIAAGDNEVEVAATDGNGGLFGVYPGTQPTIYDGSNTETFTVESISGTTITTTSPLLYDHTVPNVPDFLPVTCVPADVQQAAIFMTTALIKTRGDNSLTLDGISEPDRMQSTAGAVNEDMYTAMGMLAPYRVRVKSKV